MRQQRDAHRPRRHLVSPGPADRPRGDGAPVRHRAAARARRPPRPRHPGREARHRGRGDRLSRADDDDGGRRRDAPHRLRARQRRRGHRRPRPSADASSTPPTAPRRASRCATGSRPSCRARFITNWPRSRWPKAMTRPASGRTAPFSRSTRATRAMTLVERLAAALDRAGPDDLLPGDLDEDSTAPLREAAVLVAITDRPEPGLILTHRHDDPARPWRADRLSRRPHRRGRGAARRRAARGMGGTRPRPGPGPHHRRRRPLSHHHRLRRHPGRRQRSRPTCRSSPIRAKSPTGSKPRSPSSSTPPTTSSRQTCLQGPPALLLRDRLARAAASGARPRRCSSICRGARGEGRSALWLDAPRRRATCSTRSTPAGGKARFVGGAVRDALLGLAVDDLDLATPLAPLEVVAPARGARGSRRSRPGSPTAPSPRSPRARWSKSPPCAATSTPTAAAPRSPSPTIGRPTPRAATSPSTRSTPTRSAAR